MDQFAEEGLANKTHQIIYKNIFEKFTDLLSKKLGLRTRAREYIVQLFRDWDNIFSEIYVTGIALRGSQR
jgi:hypothetical protein